MLCRRLLSTTRQSGVASIRRSSVVAAASLPPCRRAVGSILRSSPLATSVRRFTASAAPKAAAAAAAPAAYWTEREAVSEPEKAKILHFTSDLYYTRGRTMKPFRIFFRSPNSTAATASSGGRAMIPPAQSWVRMVYPFSTDHALQSIYSLFETDQLRTGKILEDLDAFAADVAYRHCGVTRTSTVRGTNGGADSVTARDELTIVTASLDRVGFVGRLSKHKDLRVEGVVTFVGTSSLEVRVDLWSCAPAGAAGAAASSGDEFLGSAYFIMVARDPKLSKAVIVNGVAPLTAQEKEWFRSGESNRQQRITEREKSLEKRPPAPDESELIHNLWLLRKSGTGKVPPALESTLGSSSSALAAPLLMEGTKISETSAMQYQDRNIHNKIFGGHLMRLAYQLAWVNVYKVTGLAPAPALIDDIRFVHPVNIGDVMTFNSQIVYTNPRTGLALAHVDAVVTDPITKTAKTTNEFYFGFVCTERASTLSHHTDSSTPPAASATAPAPVPVPFVMPTSYDEAMLFLDGRRRATAINTSTKPN